MTLWQQTFLRLILIAALVWYIPAAGHVRPAVQEQTALAATLGLLDQFDAVDTLTSRDLASANPALKNSFDANRTRAHLEAMQVFSETAMRKQRWPRLFGGRLGPIFGAGE